MNCQCSSCSISQLHGACPGSEFKGFSVTIPFKEDALECCAEVDPLARKIGAVNTLILDEGAMGLMGYNTDCMAAISAVEAGLPARDDGE